LPSQRQHFQKNCGFVGQIFPKVPFAVLSEISGLQVKNFPPSFKLLAPTPVYAPARRVAKKRVAKSRPSRAAEGCATTKPIYHEF
jgi:hypothetical protein